MRIDDPVARIMSVPVYSVRSSQPVSDVRRLIQEHGFHHVPVVDDGVLVGMLSSSDLVGLSVGDLGGRRGRQRGVDERGEQRLEQSNMNVFSNKIIQSGVDAHVVLISNNDICINAPLGSGQCPNDTNPPKYLHVNVGVGSNDALAKILSTHEQWKDAMRPDGKKHVIVVSDDNASGVVASSFHSMFQALGPSYTGYFFHAIVGTWDVGDFLKCAADAFCCATIADEGKEYKKLVSMTGGVLGPLCEGGKQKFNELFDALSKDVIEQAPILCEWTIPEPMGMELDFGKVNVDYLDGKGGSQAIPKVDDLNACGGLDAWYYDDNAMPTKIFACPALCSKIASIGEFARAAEYFGGAWALTRASISLQCAQLCRSTPTSARSAVGMRSTSRNLAIRL
jgi:hypothetical protein